MNIDDKILLATVISGRNLKEHMRNPNFNPNPSLAATGIYVGVYDATNNYVKAYLKKQDANVQRAACHAISFAASLAVSAAVMRSFGHRSFRWVVDLTLIALLSFAHETARANNSRAGTSCALFAAYFFGNCIEKMHNPEFDAVASSVPAAIYLGTNYALKDRVSKWTGLNESTVQITLPPVAMWLLTAPVCSLLGRELVIIPSGLLAVCFTCGAVNELLNRT